MDIDLEHKMTTGEMTTDLAIETPYGVFGERDIQDIYRSFCGHTSVRMIRAALDFGQPDAEVLLNRIKGCLVISELITELECTCNEELRASAQVRLEQLVSRTLGQYSNACACLELLPILPRRSKAQSMILEKAITDASTTAGVLHICDRPEIALFPDLEDTALKKAVELLAASSDATYLLKKLSPGDPLKFVVVRRMAGILNKSRK